MTVDVERSISQRLWNEGWVPALLRGRISVRGAPFAGEAQTLSYSFRRAGAQGAGPGRGLRGAGLGFCQTSQAAFSPQS